MKLIWLDIESSGLDPQRHAILEVAAGLADLRSPFELSTLDRFVLRYADAHVYGSQCREPAPPDLVGLGEDHGPCAACDFSPEARAMHAKSGLLAECARATATMPEVEEFLLGLVAREPERGDDRPVLAGSTVHFDRGFLRVHAPRFVAKLLHRHYDVSTVKLFCESLGMPRIAKAEAHRALEDVAESVNHAQICARWLMREGLKRGGKEVSP